MLRFSEILLCRQLQRHFQGAWNTVGPIKLQESRVAHWHLREIDCSSAKVGRPAAGADLGGKSIHWPHMWCQKVLHSSCCGWQHNYYSQQRQAGQANESTSLRCLWIGYKWLLTIVSEWLGVRLIKRQFHKKLLCFEIMHSNCFKLITWLATSNYALRYSRVE